MDARPEQRCGDFACPLLIRGHPATGERSERTCFGACQTWNLIPRVALSVCGHPRRNSREMRALDRTRGWL
jgi:hypothetical protein